MPDMNCRGIMRFVIIESPFKGKGNWFFTRWIDKWRNILYARRCVRDSLLRGENPIAFHLLHTQYGILRDRVPGERQIGIDAGMAWMKKADASIFYIDKGMSPGMLYAEHKAIEAKTPREYRRIGE